MRILNMSVILLWVLLLAPISVFCELKMVALVFRHGNRTPLGTYPNDPYRDHDYDGLGYGALTRIGVQQMYEHGSRLKKSYESLFSDEGIFRNYNFQAKTSETERSLMSGLSFLAGFYPPPSDGNPISINWQPIPITTIPDESDLLIKPSCSKAKITFLGLLNNPPEDIKKMLEQDSEMIKAFENNSGLSIEELMDFSFIFDTLKIQHDLGMKMPDWVTQEYVEKLDVYLGRFLNLITETDELKKLVGGPLITEIMDEMYNATQNDNHKRVFIYSGHDSTISALLRSLSIDSGQNSVIDFGATLAFELHQSENVYEVKIKYYPSADALSPIEIDIPNCKPCYLDQYTSLYQHLIVRNLESLCQN